MKALAAKHGVSTTTVMSVTRGAPARINIGEAVRSIKTPEQIQEEIDTMPKSLQALATKLLIEHKPVRALIRETGRSHPKEQNILLNTCSEILNRLKK